jgi:hypothetical protein
MYNYNRVNKPHNGKVNILFVLLGFIALFAISSLRLKQ